MSADPKTARFLWALRTKTPCVSLEERPGRTLARRALRQGNRVVVLGTRMPKDTMIFLQTIMEGE